jgi:hypothetical protein
MWEIIKNVYPELTYEDSLSGIIELRDDGDGIVYLQIWSYSKPIPNGLKLGK